MSAGEYRGTPWPYTKYFGCLGSGQAKDSLLAALLTNATAVSGPIISVEDDAIDSGAAVTTLSGGPQLVPRPKGADRGPAGLQKLVESEVARITPVIKAAGVTAN
jgi:hypothetical protein